MKRRAAWLVTGLLATAGCGLQPVYSGGSKGVTATTLTDIAVAPIPDRSGYLVRAALREQLGEPVATPRYRLEVELDDQIIGFGIRDNNTIAAERRTLRARYRLLDAGGNIVLDATTGSDVNIDRPRSDYALVAAETTALERLAVVVARQIVQRLALFARTPPPAAKPSG